MADPSKDPSLAERLAEALPLNAPFRFHHISTPPTRAPALFAAPPGAKPERTYLESHLLAASMRTDDAKEVFVLAIEIYIYSTRHLTTIFVSKADSTGYLGLLSLEKGHTSPLRTIATCFLDYLVEKRQRKNVKLVVSLFARANDQYLFPGSAENKAKHVSDDRQLVKWWCRVLDPVLRKYKSEDTRDETMADEASSQAYVIVPGEDGIASFLPQDVRLNPELRKRWKHGHPLEDISHHPMAPPRCLVPHFPDDPKARFLDELDDELPDGQSSQVQESPSKRGSGRWRSVRSLGQFWEMMAYRQECSSGRLVGFIWVVFTPPDHGIVTMEGDSQETQSSSKLSRSSSDLKSSISSPSASPSKLRSPRRPQPAQRRRKLLRGPIIPRMPKIKSASSTLSNMTVREDSKYYLWPASSRGEIILNDKDYKKAGEVLLRLDFANLEIAAKSTKTWIEEVRMLDGKAGKWGQSIVGRKPATVISHPPVTSQSTNGTANTLSVKRKSGVIEGEYDGVNTLGAGLMKKKPKKVQLETVASESSAPGVPPVADDINVLGAGLVRKKAKLG